MRKWVGVLRDAVYSPQSNDLLIMERVKQNLEQGGDSVELIEESRLEAPVSGAQGYFSMARSEKTLSLLDQIREQGTVVVNPAQGVRNCARPIITRLMMNNGIDIPRSQVVNGVEGEKLHSPVGYPCWLKRGDSCAQEKEDVAFVRSPEEYAEAWKNFDGRGIREAVVAEHLEGDVVKFYGVAETDFFFWYYPTLGKCHSKFGLESINGAAQCFPFDEKKLKQAADRVAQISETPVYGGDCIVNPCGIAKIIDFNDWPSFSRCADEAAKAITKYILNQIKDNGRY